MPFKINAYRDACPTCIAIDVIKYPDKDSLREKRFILTQLQVTTLHCGVVTVTELAAVRCITPCSRAGSHKCTHAHCFSGCARADFSLIQFKVLCLGKGAASSVWDFPIMLP